MEQQILNKYLNLNKKWIVLALTIWALSYVINVWPLVFLALFCLLNIGLMVYDRYVQIPIDLELSTFATVLMTMQFGLKWGIAAAVLTKVAAMISNKDFNKNSIVSIAAYILAAVLTNLMSGMPVILTGVIVVLLVNIFTAVVSRFILFVSGFEVVLFTVSNFVFNFVLFVGFADILLRIIKVI